MPTKVPFDVDTGHRYFAAECFNFVWSLLDKHARSFEEERLMLSAAHASLFHWMKVPGVTARELSVGYWQVSRVNAVLGIADEAKRAADISLQFASELPAFYKGYALEAKARAELLGGSRENAITHLSAAREHLQHVQDEEEKELLRGDLRSLGLDE